ncbi:MAG: PAS domain-containing protein [Deltaproteobacteria bacterium]|nr:PAS domain-containing protein [Deltaproteobacteria bacterium]
MIRNRPLVVVVTALLLSLTVLSIVGWRVLGRDRRAIYDRFAHERLLSLEEAARGLESDVAEIREDLELAATLLQNAETTRVAERELHAIATIKREYLMMEARAESHERTRVVAFDAPLDTATVADAALSRALDEAEAHRERIAISPPLGGEGEPSAWYRVFARRVQARQLSMGVVVDTRLLLAKLKFLRDRSSVLVILGTDRAIAPMSDRGLTETVRSGAFAELATKALAGQPATLIVDANIARASGLAATTAVGVAVPVRVDQGAPWAFITVSSTSALEAQEATLARRILVLGALVLALLLAAAGYVLHNARRTATLRENLRHVDRLAHLTEKAEKIVDHIPSGVLALSDDRRVTAANRWFTDRFPRDVTGQRLEHVFIGAPPEDIATMVKLVERAMTSGIPQSLHRARLGLLGQDAFLSVHAIPLERGIADVSLLVVFEDLTTLRRIEEQLLHSEKLVTAGQLAAGIAHEIGTPLNVARGRAELLLARDEPADAANHRIIIEQIDLVVRLIQQLLDYVRPASSEIALVDVGSIMGNVAGLLSPEAGKRTIELRVEPPGRLELRVDPDQIQQILVNLVINAIDACDPQGRVDLRASAREDAIVFEVSDDGQGIPHELQPQIFDPFFTTKKRGQGTGLGLWLVAQLVSAHAGTIEVESTPGSGTTIRVVWPTR